MTRQISWIRARAWKFSEKKNRKTTRLDRILRKEKRERQLGRIRKKTITRHRIVQEEGLQLRIKSGIYSQKDNQDLFVIFDIFFFVISLKIGVAKRIQKRVNEAKIKIFRLRIIF